MTSPQGTAFSQASNHPTAFNHSHRDMSGKDVAACAARVPCCGITQAAGSPCKICKKQIPAPKVKPDWSVKTETLAEKKKREAAEAAGTGAGSETVKK